MLRSTVYGDGELALDDPAEHYHEASKLYPALGERQGAGIARLAADSDLQAALLRAVRRNRQLPAIDLCTPQPPDASLWAAIANRHSAQPSEPGSLGLPALATMLLAGYGVDERGRRSVPSGGALYPLELYVAACRVNGLPPGLLHLDPERRVLEVLHDGDVADELLAATPLPDLLADAAAVVFVTAVFWRTRVKYGLRGYRFALLEAGHVVQNVLLAATALGTPAFPLGGFFDTAVEEMLGVDGVDESVVYGAVLGGDAG
jgi:SagB-type dehydrogenase family enzyme